MKSLLIISVKNRMVKASLRENEYSQHRKLQAFISLPAFNFKHVTMMYVSANVGLSLEETPVSTSTLERTRTSVLENMTAAPVQ